MRLRRQKTAKNKRLDENCRIRQFRPQLPKVWIM